ncbi:MAG: maleylpyruvate isomerase N-terminal domain-containing protein [Sporichthyaceae bacterium]
MDQAGVYRASRERMLALAAGLSAEQAHTTVPATPLWTVTDIYRHLTGLVDDVLSANWAGRGTDAWTAAQVAARADRSLAEVCADWAANGPAFEAAIAAAPADFARPVIDAWTHEQDVLGALGRRGDRDDCALPTLVAMLAGMYAQGWKVSDPAPPTVDLVIDCHRHRLGVGNPELTLTTSAYEFVRLGVSRRSHAQLLAAGWTGEHPERLFPILCRFDLPVADLTD